MNSFHHLSRREFRGKLDGVLHPSGNIVIPQQLKGREKSLAEMRDCFETPGAQAFIWGPRGVGKTSLGHTSCAKHDDIVKFAAAVACEKNMTTSQLFSDLVTAIVHGNKMALSDKNMAAKLAGFGIEISGDLGRTKESFSIESPNQAAALLSTILPPTQYIEQKPVIIVDEFDLLKNRETHRMLSSILKQLSVDESPVKFVFCGVARDLDELLGSHESVERYVYGIELKPLSHDAIWEIVHDVEDMFSVSFNKGQLMRISQISSGYAHFTHLMLKNILLRAYEAGVTENEIPADIYKEGIHASAEQAATRLKAAYERATKRGTDRYIEVLWAVANDVHLDRQFKNILRDYDAIMARRTHREGYDTKDRNGIALRNALNALEQAGFLVKGKTGWYQFEDPMFRSYVRMVAEQEGIQLGDESFNN